MSRTYRRIHARHEYAWLLRTYVRQPFWRYFPIDLKMVPAWYRRADERSKRHRENHACLVIPQHGGGEALTFRRRSTIRYDWW